MPSYVTLTDEELEARLQLFSHELRQENVVRSRVHFDLSERVAHLENLVRNLENRLVESRLINIAEDGGNVFSRDPYFGVPEEQRPNPRVLREAYRGAENLSSHSRIAERHRMPKPVAPSKTLWESLMEED